MIKIIKNEKGADSTRTLEVEIAWAAVEKSKEKTFESLKNTFELPGFRKGKVPEKMILEKVGEEALLEESAQNAIEDVYGDIMKEANIFPVAMPRVVIKKIESGSPLLIEILVDVFPEISIGDWKKNASKVKVETPEEVTEKEVEDVVAEITRMRAPEGGTLTDDFVKTLGDFKDIQDFKDKIKDNLAKEKERKAKEKTRLAKLKAVTDGASIEVPHSFVENELEQMKHEFSVDLEQSGENFENYKKQIGKTDAEIFDLWRPKAKDRVLNELVLSEIIKTEKLTADAEKQKHEVEHLKEHDPDATDEKLNNFVSDLLKKEEAFKLLESLS